MIANDKSLKRICKDYNLVENYMQARFDKENKWELHHRKEIDENKKRKELIAEGRYYNVEPEELIFLTREEHNKLHHTGNKHNLGKHYSEDTKKKISENHKGMLGKQHSEETKKKISDVRKGIHWYNNGIVEIMSKECPDGFVRGRL